MCVKETVASSLPWKDTKSLQSRFKPLVLFSFSFILIQSLLMLLLNKAIHICPGLEDEAAYSMLQYSFFILCDDS